MTKEQILERIKELETNRESMKGNFIAIEGAIQDCNYWMEQLDKAVSEKKDIKTAKPSKE